MLAPTLRYRTAVVVCAASTTQTLPEPAVAVLAADAQPAANTTSGVITSSALTITTAAPAAGQLQFTGTPQAPSNQVTLNAAATAGQLLVVQYIARGDLASAA
jgi:hypothetical protein